MSKSLKERAIEGHDPLGAPETDSTKQPVTEEALAQTAAMNDADKPSGPAATVAVDEALADEVTTPRDEDGAESGAVHLAQSIDAEVEMQGASEQGAAAEEEVAATTAPLEVVPALAITCLVPNLKAALRIVGKAVATKTMLPVLNCVLLETAGGRLRLQATNLEVGITQYLDCQVMSEGAVAVPAALFGDFVADLPADKLDMTLDPVRHILHLECGRFVANIKCLPAADFPLVPTYQSQPALATLEGEQLAAAIAEVEFAAARDDSRPVLTGVLMRFAGGQLTMAGTDGYRLAEKKLAVEGVSDNPPIIVPARVLKELSSILERGGDQVIIATTPNRNQALFHATKVDLVARLIDGPFPNYGQIIPTGYQSRFVLPTDELRHAVKMAGTFARDSQHIVKLKMEPGGEDDGDKLVITANSAEVGDNKSVLDGELEGEGVVIAFNARLMLDVLDAITTPQVALETNSPTSPGVLRPVGQEAGTSTIYVVMPMNLFR